jgi:hypothetical protein
MKKKILIILILFLNSCGFNPVFNSEQNKFSINKITVANNNQITNKIKNNLKRFVQNTNSANSYDVKLSTKKNIIVTSKDKQGDPKTFEITIEVKLIINNQKSKKQKIFKENFAYENNKNKFDLKNYENEIAKNLVESIMLKMNNYFLTLE